MQIECDTCGNRQAMLTARDVAEILRISPVTIRQRARERGIGIDVDQRTRLYTVADLAALGER